MDLQESLHDIAQLLLLIHESYLSGVVGVKDILFSLVGFIDGLDLLGNRVSVLHIELCRRRACGSDNSTVMDYTHFYCWLKEIANIVYPREAGGNNAAIQRFLVDNVIPLASKGFPEIIDISESILFPDPSLYDILESYESFFKMLFYVAHGESQAMNKFASVVLLWDHIVSSNMRVTYKNLVQFVRALDLVDVSLASTPNSNHLENDNMYVIKDLEVVKSCFDRSMCRIHLETTLIPCEDTEEMNLKPDEGTTKWEDSLETSRDSSDVDLSSPQEEPAVPKLCSDYGLNFTEFCLFMYHLSMELTPTALSEANRHGTGSFTEDSFDTLGAVRNRPDGCFMYLINMISKHMVEQIIINNCITHSSLAKHTIHSSSIMNLCRNSGLFRHCSIQGLCSVAGLIQSANWKLKRSDVTVTPGGAVAAKLSISCLEKVLLNICQVIELASGALYGKANEIETLCTNSVSSRCSLYIVRICPFLVLSSGIDVGSVDSVPDRLLPSVPTLLDGLYNVRLVPKCMGDIRRSLESILQQLVPVAPSENTTVSCARCDIRVSSVLRLLTQKCVVPMLIGKLIAYNVVSYFSDFSCSSRLSVGVMQHNEMVKLDNMYIASFDAIEILYAIAQLSFNERFAGDRAASISEVHHWAEIEDSLTSLSVGDDESVSSSSRHRIALDNFLQFVQLIMDPDEPLRKVMDARRFNDSNIPLDLLTSVLLEATVETPDPGAVEEKLAEEDGEVQIRRAGSADTLSLASDISWGDDLMTDVWMLLSSNAANASTVAASVCKPLSSKEIMLILAHFPLNNLTLTPWHLYESFFGHFDGVKDLHSILHLFCLRYDVGFSVLTEYFASLYELVPSEIAGETEKGEAAGDVEAKASPAPAATKMRILSIVRNTIMCDTLNILTDSDVLTLLAANEQLVRWEFFLCCSYHSFTRPSQQNPNSIEGSNVKLLTDGSASDSKKRVCTPMPDSWGYHDSSVNIVITKDAARLWVNEVALTTIPVEIFDAIYDKCFVIPSKFRDYPLGKSRSTPADGRYLTFNLFVVFMVKVFTYSISSSVDGVVRDAHLKSVLQHSFLGAIQQMLQVFSNRLSSIQQTIQAQVLTHIASNPFLAPVVPQSVRNTPSTDVVRETMKKECEITKNLSLHCVREFMEMCRLQMTKRMSTSSSKLSCLPPFPHEKFWDACRFVGYCRYMGIMSSGLVNFRITTLWQIFGIFQSVMRQLQQSAPIKLSAVDDLIKKTVKHMMLHNFSIRCSNESSTSVNILVSPKPIRVDLSKLVEGMGANNSKVESATAVANADWYQILFSCLKHYEYERIWDYEQNYGSNCLADSTKAIAAGSNVSAEALKLYLSSKTVEFDHHMKRAVLSKTISRINHKLTVTGGSRESIDADDFDFDSFGIEELLRYGGQSAMNSRIYFEYLVDSTYEFMVRSSRSEHNNIVLCEPTIDIVAKFISVDFSMMAETAVLELIEKSIHVRQRSVLYKKVAPAFPNIRDSDSSGFVLDSLLTISRQEYDEILMKCAFELYCMAGVATTNISNQTQQKSAVPWVVSSVECIELGALVPSLAILDYCKHCDERLDYRFLLPQDQSSGSPSNHKNSYHTVNAWGTDFIWAYFASLQNSFVTIQRTLSDEGTSSQYGMINAFFYNKIYDHSLPNTFQQQSLSVETSTCGRFSLDSNVHSPFLRNSPRIQITSSTSPLSGAVDSVKSCTLANESIDFTGSEKSATTLGSFERRKPFNVSSERANNAKKLVSAIEEISDGTKEALWPLYLTYCSCADSLDPGKLSGPNVISMLSKLNLLNNNTVLSDIGLLLHQVSTHTIVVTTQQFANIMKKTEPPKVRCNSPTSGKKSEAEKDAKTGDAFESPALLFEEFLVFICAFSQLYYEGHINAGGHNDELSMDTLSDGATATSNNELFDKWQIVASSSVCFKKLMEDRIMPLLRSKKFPLLAAPKDSRRRDIFASLFSIEIILALQDTEELLYSLLKADCQQYLAGSLSNSASKHRNSDGKLIFRPSIIVESLKDLELVPDVISETTLNEIISDILADYVLENSHQVEVDTHANSHNVLSPCSSISSVSFAHSGDASPLPSAGSTAQDKLNKVLSLSQWEWIMCLIAYHAVAFAIDQKLKQRGHSRNGVNIKKIPVMISDVVKTVAKSMIGLCS